MAETLEVLIATSVYSPLKDGAHVELHDVTKIYKMEGGEPLHALCGVQLEIEAGELIAVMGASGSGKSTLLHIIGGLDTASSGTITVDGQDLSRAGDVELSRYRNRKAGFIFQSFNLHPSYTALENVIMPLLFSSVKRSRRREVAYDALEAVGMADRASHHPNQLSGGEKQRVSIARAIVTQPKILLADEPTGNLDSARGKQIIELLTNLNTERGTTTILVTHDRDIAKQMPRVLLLSDGSIIDDRKTAS